MDYKVQHNIAENRFEVILDNLISMVEYQIDKDGNMKVFHSEVPVALEGRGIAAAMTKTLLEYVKEKQIKVYPLCSYTRAYIDRHPEYRELVIK